MKKFALALCVLLPGVQAFSQHSQVSYSKEFKVVERDYRDQTVSHSIAVDNSFYTVNHSAIPKGKWLFTKLYDVHFGVTISKYDNNMSLVKEYEIEKGADDFGPIEPELLLFNKQLHVAYFKALDKASFSLYLAAVDTNTLAITNPRKIATIQQENVGIFRIEGIMKAGAVYFCESPDHSRMLVVSKISDNSVDVKVLDASLNPVLSSVLSIPTADFKIVSAALSSDNKACLVAEGGEEAKILCINEKGKKVDIKYRGSSTVSPYKTRVQVSKDGKRFMLVSNGVYAAEEVKRCYGFMTADIDIATLKIAKPSVYEFTPEFLQNMVEKGGGVKHRKEYSMFTFDPLLVEMENGSVAVVGSPQEYKVTTRESAPNSNMQTKTVMTTTNTTGPLMAFFPDKSGKSFEHALVPRSIALSTVSSSGYGAIQIVSSTPVSGSPSGFIASTSGDEILFIYNDDVDNLGKPLTEKPVKVDRANELALAEAVIGKDRSVAYRKQVGIDQKGRYTYYIGSIIPSASNAIIFPIGKAGAGFNGYKTFFTNWCYVNVR